VLVRGAAGSIGIMTVQLAAHGGASAVAVTTSSAVRGDRLRNAFFLRQAQPERPHGGRGRRCGLPAGGLRHDDDGSVPEVAVVRDLQLLPLEQAVLAHQKMDAGEVFGRIVLVPPGG
jgi:threonine dehydrogenase-like Zn-dependent dehydrogenase